MSRASRRALALSLLVSLLGCRKPTESPFPVNECSSDRDCWEGTRCFEAFNVCARDTAEVPYDVVLQIDPPGGRTNRYTWGVLPLERSNEELMLELAEPLAITGSIGQGDRQVRAELVFKPVPAQPGLPVASVVVRTVSGGEEQRENLSVRLPSRTVFDVSIQPLGPDSEAFPPVQTRFETGDGAAPFRYDYGALDHLEQQLRAGEQPVAGARVRLISRASGRAVSSTVETDEAGNFALEVQRDVLSASDYALQINLDPENPWREVIEVGADRIDLAADPALREPVVIPRVPARVTFNGSTEAAQVESAPNLEVTFVSTFPVPLLPGDVRDRDWCRADEADTRSPFTCRSTRVTYSNPEGDFTIDLLPGIYDVFISPGPESFSTQRIATSKFARNVETQLAGAPIGPVVFELGSATRLTGTVRDSESELLPNVVVRTSALGLIGVLSDVAAYNRPASAVSDRQGGFTLSVDEGYYDVIAEPPQGSGYAPAFQLNRLFDPDRSEETQLRTFILQPPVVLGGKVLDAQGEPVAEADIDAFAVVPDLRGGKRAVLIGRTTSDENGAYVLPLPPTMTE